MTNSDESRSRSFLAEAIEQTADAAHLWTQNLANFAQDEAAMLASGSYGLGDLVSAAVRWMRAVVDSGTRSLQLLPDNIALLAAGSSGKEARTIRSDDVDLDTPAPAGARFEPTPLQGIEHGQVIPVDRISVTPMLATTVTTEVMVQVDVFGVANDTYLGEVRTQDGVRGEIRMAIDELGEPWPP